MAGRIHSLGRRLRDPWDRRHARRRLRRFHARLPPLAVTVRCALDLGTRGRYRVRAVQREEELLWLGARLQRLRPRTLLEIGTHEGGTLFFFAQFVRRCLITVDRRDPGPRRRLFPAFPPPERNVAVHVVVGDSHAAATAAAVRRRLAGSPLDVLFLDGDHAEAGVARDLELYGPLVRPGGLVVFHDVNPRPAEATHGVHRLFARLPGRKEVLLGRPELPGYGLGLWWG